ncbi:hypothetical protein HQ563_18905 [bacterium]|nr:hypothetical protein [bacterium]
MTRAIWIVGLIGLAAMILFLATDTDDDKDEPAPPTPLPLPERKPGFTVENLQCPVCEGYGYIMEEARTGARRRICQLCAGKGGKVLRIPPGNVRCPNCQGFGRTRTAKRYVVCLRCGGRGYVKQPFQPGE